MSQETTRRAVKGWRYRTAVKLANSITAERDKYKEALETIAKTEWVDNALDPQRAARIASEALNPKNPR